MGKQDLVFWTDAARRVEMQLVKEKPVPRVDQCYVTTDHIIQQWSAELTFAARENQYFFSMW